LFYWKWFSFWTLNLQGSVFQVGLGLVTEQAFGKRNHVVCGHEHRGWKPDVFVLKGACSPEATVFIFTVMLQA